MVNVAALIFAATITFSPFSGIIAYLITYDEYRHHLDPKRARRQAVYMAVFSFVIFIAVGLFSGFVFNDIVSH